MFTKLGWTLVVVGAAFVFLGFGSGLDTYLEWRAIDRGRVCRPGESDDCYAERRAVVRRRGFLEDTRVTFDDGRVTEGLTLRTFDDPQLEPGTVVRAEIWDGEVIAIYDPATGRHFRTLNWPQRIDPYALAFLLLGALLAITPFVRHLLRGARRRGPPRRPGLPRVRRRAAAGP